MLKIVSSLNGFSVRQSVVSDGPRYRAAVAVKKYIFFQFFFIIFKKKMRKKMFFGKKRFFSWFFWVLFHVRQRMEDDLQNIFFSKILKKNIFFVFLEKNKKYFFGWNFFLVIFRGRRPMEDDLTNNLTSLHFPDACVSSIQLLLLLF